MGQLVGGSSSSSATTSILPNGLVPKRGATDYVQFSAPVATATDGAYGFGAPVSVFNSFNNQSGLLTPTTANEDLILLGIQDSGTPAQFAFHQVWTGDNVVIIAVATCFDPAGNMYILTQPSGGAFITGVFKLAPDRTISLIAGSSGLGTSTDGIGTSAAFNYPVAMCYAADGNIYVSEQSQKIRKVAPATGAVTTLCGNGTVGSADGTGTAATLNYPYGIIYNQFDGNLYVVENGGNKIRKITLGGVVTTFAGPPAGSTVSGSGDGTGTGATFSGPWGLTHDPSSGTMWVGDANNNRIRQVTIGAVVTTIAGSATAGSIDATGTSASFYTPTWLTYDGKGSLYIKQLGTSTGHHVLRRLTLGSNVVITLAGNINSVGNFEGTNSTGNYPTFGTGSDTGGLTMDPNGNVVYADYKMNRLKRVAPDGRVSWLLGGAVTANSDLYTYLTSQFPATAMTRLTEVGRLVTTAVGSMAFLPFAYPVKVSAGQKVWLSTRVNSTAVTNYSLTLAYAPASVFS